MASTAVRARGPRAWAARFVRYPPLATAIDAQLTDILQTAALGIQTLILGLAAIYARGQVAEAKQLREEQGRPFVIVDLAEGSRPKTYDIVVQNIGKTVARGVQIRFDHPQPKSSMGEIASLDKLKIFRDGVATMPPGKEFRATFDSGPSRHQADLPDVYSGSVTYSGPSLPSARFLGLFGRRQDPDHYKEKFELDFGLYWNRLSVTTRDIHDLYGEVRRMRLIMGKWTSPGARGILRRTRADIALEHAEVAAVHPWWKAPLSKREEFGRRWRLALARRRARLYR